MTTTDQQSISLRQLSRDYHEGRINYERYQSERARVLDGASGWEGDGADTAPEHLNDLTTTAPHTTPSRSQPAPEEHRAEAPRPAPTPASQLDWRWIIGAFLLGQASMAILFLVLR